jgi:hypothetical protein
VISQIPLTPDTPITGVADGLRLVIVGAGLAETKAAGARAPSAPRNAHHSPRTALAATGRRGPQVFLLPVTVSATPISKTDAITATMDPKTLSSKMLPCQTDSPDTSDNRADQPEHQCGDYTEALLAKLHQCSDDEARDDESNHGCDLLPG